MTFEQFCSGMLDQSIVDEFCASGELPSQIQKVRAFYRGKRATMLDALEKHLTGRATWTSAAGGLFTFMTMNDDVDTAALVPDAVARGVAYVPGGPSEDCGGYRAIGSRLRRVTGHRSPVSWAFALAPMTHDQ